MKFQNKTSYWNFKMKHHIIFQNVYIAYNFIIWEHLSRHATIISRSTEYNAEDYILDIVL